MEFEHVTVYLPFIPPEAPDSRTAGDCIVPDCLRLNPDAAGGAAHLSTMSPLSHLLPALTAERGKDALDTFLLKANVFAQQSALAGAAPADEVDLRANYEYKPEAAWQIAVDRAAREKVVAGNLATDADLRSRVSDVIATGDLTIELWEALQQRLAAAGITGDEFISGGRKSMDTFLDLMPSSVVRRTIREHVQRTASRQPTVNDVNDGDLFGTLVPHSNIVVLEKSAHHALTQAQIGQRYNVELLRSMTDIPNALEQLLNS